MWTPSHPRSTLPSVRSDSTTDSATFAGIAKPMPTFPPVGLKIAVFTPTTRPPRSNRGAAGVAAVDRGVDLEEVVVGAGADVAPAARDDARGDGAPEPEGVSDRDHPVADPRTVGVPELDCRQRIAGVHLDEREIGLRVHAHYLGFELAPVLKRHGHRVGPLHHVVAGDDEP